MNNIKNLKIILIIITLLLLAACGGKTTVINGVASKGIITNGTVTVFALNSDGSKGLQLGTGSTDATGAYSISLGSYSGPVIVEAYGGYTDEATGLPMFVPASAPLRAAMANATGTVFLPVTALTELAVRQAGTLTPRNITTANTLISDLFKVDIVTTAPVAPTSSAFQSSTTTQSQKDYALILAAVSQQMQTGGGNLAATLTTLNSGISQTGMTPETASIIRTAVSDFIANPTNQTGVTTVDGTPLQSVGATTMKLIIVLQGSAAASVKGIQATIKLPAGVTLRAELAGGVLNGVITPAANSPSGIIDGKYYAVSIDSQTTLTLGYGTSGNLTAGDILILNADLLPGFAAPASSAFTFSSSKLIDFTGNVVNEASLTLR